ncbi:MAG: hypothetical protein Q9M97_02655 [Candidatus Gracilibacteria bacterium]|nr:hypothetical protein [Candidatus Gracilibacteria bacterium]
MPNIGLLGDMIGYDMIGYDMIGYDMIGYDMIGYDMIGYDMIGYDMIGYDGTKLKILCQVKNLFILKINLKNYGFLRKSRNFYRIISRGK